MLIGYFPTKPVWRTLVINSIANIIKSGRGKKECRRSQN